MRGVRRGRGEQVLERARVVAEDRALADAEAAAALDVDDVAVGERLGAPASTASRPDVTARLAPAARSASMIASARASSSRRVDRRPHRRGDDGGRQHLVEPADRVAHQVREGHDVAARLGVVAVERDRLAEGDERARLVADRVAHHLRDLAPERPRAAASSPWCARM